MLKFYILIALIVTFDLIAAISGKQFAITDNPVFLILTSLGFAIAGFFFAHSLKFESLAITNVLWIALSIVLVTVAGHFLFREHISAVQYIGIGVILVGVVLLNFHDRFA